MLFDFGGQSDVTLHACTTNKDAAEAIFSKLDAAFKPYNKKVVKEGAAKLVDLIHVPDDYVSEEGHTFYWDQAYNTCPRSVTIEGAEYEVRYSMKDPRAKVLKSNNDDLCDLVDEEATSQL